MANLPWQAASSRDPMTESGGVVQTGLRDLPPPYQSINAGGPSGSSSSRLETAQLLSSGSSGVRPPLSANARRGKHQVDGSQVPLVLTPEANVIEYEYDLDIPPEQPPSKTRRLFVALAILIIVILAIILPIYFVVIKRKNHLATRGANGSTVIMEDGTSFVYENQFGGFWVDDLDNPYDNSAQPNSWTPSLNESWDFTKLQIHGVNLAGLFVLEPFVTPAIFQKYPSAVDEWTLSLEMANDTENGGMSQIEDHYKTFITEQDIAEIAGAGLTWVRLPIGFWTIETFPGEPFLAKTSWPYIVRVLQWCRKYGLRVDLVLDAVPGSQNGFDYGGKFGSVDFLSGVMGMANAQRTLYYIRVITEFISQPEWTKVIPVFTILNDPFAVKIGTEQLKAFYVEAHRMVREITGYGEGNGPYLVIDTGFEPESSFAGDMNGADRVILGRTLYVSWAVTPATSVSAGSIGQACTTFGPSLNASRANFGITVTGGYSAAFLDCGLFLNGVGYNATYQGDCSVWDDSSNWGPGTKTSLSQFVAAQMDAARDSFFYTWKVSPSAQGGIQTPMWSYQLGLQQGWINNDPRKSIGICQTLENPPAAGWNGTYSPWMTGGVGAFVATDGSAYPWPPTTFSRTGTVSFLIMPTYTATATPVTLPQPTFTDSKGKAVSISHGSPLGRVPAPTPVAGCVYPDAWNAENVDFPNSLGCGVAGAIPTSSGSSSAPSPLLGSLTGAPSSSITPPPPQR